MTNWNTQLAGIRLDNAAGTLTDISAYINGADIDGGQTLLDDTGLAMTNESVTPGLGKPTMVALNGFLNSTTEGIFGPLVNGTSVQKTVEIKHFTGKYHYGESWPESVKISKAPGAIQTWSCNLLAESGLTKTSIAVS